MADPTGTVGARSQASDLDLAAIGGSEFTERLSRLASAKDNHDRAERASRKALDELNLGMSATEAFSASGTKAAEAEHMVENAKADAAKIVSDAQAKANSIIGDAQSRQRAILRSAEEARAEANAIKAGLDAMTADIAGQHRAAKAAMADVESQKVAMDSRKKDLDIKISEAEAAKTKSSEISDKLNRHIEDLMTVIRRIASPG